ncbi:hypothetical protein AAIB41_11575 [Brucella sp. BE17]|uniref:hypothetical protein n=1 Tax=Brucella sp. BE17 TaxID=3142977 RepID=UPI0031BA079B
MFRKMFAAAALLVLFSVPNALAQETRDYLGVPGPIKVGGTDYFLSWSSNPQEGYFKQEYLPEGAVAKSYDSMVMVEFLATDAPLTDVVSAQMSTIQQRKATDPVANMAVFNNADTGEILLDFLLSAKDKNGEYILEWNGYRYVESKFKGQRGSMLLAISERAYGDKNSETFLKKLREFKAQRTLDLTRADLPKPD